MVMGEVIKIQNLYKSYGDKEVIKGISLTTYSGEVFGFLGKNGVGKSTTIDCMVGIKSFNKGEIFINGYSITGATEYVIDVTNINVDHFKRQTLFYEDYQKIEGSLTDSERDLLNPGDVYEIKLEGKTYYHLMDLADGDGDFIGMDLKKRVYLITHDPFGIKLLDKPLREILEKNLKAFANRD